MHISSLGLTKFLTTKIMLLQLEGGEGGDRRLRIFSAHNSDWASPEVNLSLIC